MEGRKNILGRERLSLDEDQEAGSSMVHRKEELEVGGWHGWITGGVGAGEPEAGDKGDQDQVGIERASRHLERFSTICGASSVFGILGARTE